jgi:outer membrane protein assembly factor BamB
VAGESSAEISKEALIKNQVFTSHRMLWQCASWIFYSLFGLLVFLPLSTPANSKSDDLILSQPLAVVWRYPSDYTTDLTPAVDSQSAFVPLGAGVLVALNAADGKLIWRTENGGEFSAAPVADERSVFVATGYAVPDEKQQRGALRAMSKATGVTLWMRTLSAPLVGALACDGSAIFGGSPDGHIYAFDNRTGLIIWSKQYAEPFSGQPVVVDGRVYIGSDTGVMRSLDSKTGEVAWEYKTGGAIRGSVAVSDNIAYFGSADANVYAFSAKKSKLLWHRRAGAAVEAVVAVENGVLASSLDNFAYLLSLHKGTLIWRRQLPGRISSRPITAKEGALFTPFSTDAAIVLNLKDGKPANTLSLGEENSRAAAPVSVNNLILITTPHALLAFAAAR